MREARAHGRLSIWMRESSNDTVDRMRCPRGIRATRSGKVRENGINITRLSIEYVIFQSYLKGSFFGLRKVGGNIFAIGG